MVAEPNILQEIFVPFVSVVNHPLIVIDKAFKIVAYNESAEKMLLISRENNLIFNLFSDNFYSDLLSLITESDKQNSIQTSKQTVTLFTGIELKFEISVSPFVFENGEKNFFISFVQEIKVEQESKKLRLTLTNEDLNEIVYNKKILEIIEEIRATYPFTFLGKGKIQNEINKLEELFWLKDADGKFVIANNKFGKIVGLRPAQIEGKAEKSFIPLYLLDFYKSIETYLKETQNNLVLDGIPFKGFAKIDNYQTVEIPLSDAENNVLAVICFAQNKSSFINKKNEIEKVETLKVFKVFPQAIAIIDKRGFIEQVSNELEKIFEFNFNSKINFAEIFPEKLSAKIREGFAFEQKTYEFEIELGNKSKFFNNFFCKLEKIFDDNNEIVNYFLVVENKTGFENFEQLFKKRGRMFDIIIRNNPEPIFIYDTENLRFIEVNESALKMYGYSRDEFLQMDLTDLYSPEDIQTLLDNSKVETEGKFSGPYKHRRKDGHSILVEIYKTSFLFEGRDTHFNIVRNISERIEKEKEFNVFKSLFENTDELLFITDNTGFIKYVNNSTKKYLGYNKSELIGNTIISLLKDEDRGEINSSIFYSHLKDKVEVSVEIKKSNNTFIQTELIAIPVLDYNKEVESFTVIGKIILPPVEVEKEIIKEVIKEVEIVKEVVIEKPVEIPISSPTNFAGVEPATISLIFHEILTPINVILGFIQEIRDGLENPTIEQKEALQFINQNSDRLLDIMNSVSEYSIITKDLATIKTEHIKISDLLESVQNELKDKYKNFSKSILFGKVSSTIDFNSDVSKVKNFLQIVLKLINAISDEDKIYISAYQTDDEHFIISIKDNQVKVTDKVLHAFDNTFKSVDASHIREFGLSRFAVLGAKGLLNRLNGKYELTQKAGKPFEIGFVFPFILTPTELTHHIEEKFGEQKSRYAEPIVQKQPAKNVPVSGSMKWQTIEQIPDEIKVPPPVIPEPEPEPIVNYIEEPQIPEAKELDLSELSCLYIEDQVDSQILFRVQVKDLKEIKFAVSFEEALPLITSYKFDFIVMDINLQGEYNGLDALKMIRQMPGFDHLPIIAVTAYVLPGDREKFIAAGFNDFISKPIFREKLIDALQKIFNK